MGALHERLDETILALPQSLLDRGLTRIRMLAQPSLAALDFLASGEEVDVHEVELEVTLRLQDADQPTDD